jgi:small subunit ribosomal protein S17
MADEEKNETPEVEPEPEVVAEAEEQPVAEETVAEPDEQPADPGAEEPGADPVAEAAPEEEPSAPEASAGRQRSHKHIPRSARRTRTKPVRERPKTRRPITRTGKPEHEPGRRQERRGVVVSDKGDKTIVVKVDVIKSHPKYKKVVRSTVKFHAHDEANTAGVGDTVRIVETRPLSKQKRWRLAEIVEKAK